MTTTFKTPMSKIGKYKMLHESNLEDQLTDMIEEVLANEVGLAKDLLRRDYMDMVEPAVAEFGEISEEVLKRVKDDFMRYHNGRKIVNGEAIGIISAQSIGENNTQLSLNSFHSVGYANSVLSQGVPRMKALIDATRSKHPVHILKTAYTDLRELDRVVGNQIRQVKLLHLIRHVDVIDNTTPEPHWHAGMPRPPKIDWSTAVRFYLEHDRLFEFKVTPDQIGQVINKTFQKGSIVAFVAPIEMGMIDVFIQPPSEKLKVDPPPMQPPIKVATFEPDPVEKVDYVHRIRPTRCLANRYTIPDLLKLTICGMKDVTDQCFVRDGDLWNIYTVGGSLGELCALPFVTSVTSRCVHSICQHFGLAAANQYIRNELHKVAGDGVNVAHTQLVASFMTFSGIIKSMTRYTMRTQCGALSKAAFEEPVDMLVSAAINGEVDNLSGCSSAIICGKAPQVGTNANIDLLMKIYASYDH